MYILSVWLSLSTCFNEVISMTCGIDKSPRKDLYEGVDRMESYPWLGILYYPRNKKRYTTSVVLVTRQLVLATALEIDKLPKTDFRARARVIVGKSCYSDRGIGIRGYTYHPEYTKSTYSALALVQLDVDNVKKELRPICPPPKAMYFLNEPFYAMVLADDCKTAMVTVHKMLYVPPDQCKIYYRRAELDLDSMWPAYTACAMSTKGGDCVWRSGAILAVKVGDSWSLLGFGVYGPGCEAPARFIDYNMYHEWVKRSVERIGRPAITRMAENYLVLRRSLSTLQQFGSCTEEEMVELSYHELGRVDYNSATTLSFGGKYTHNLTIINNVEYTCVTLRADYVRPSKLYKTSRNDPRPMLWLRRWCGDAGSIMNALCTSATQYSEIKFYMQIEFHFSLEYEINVYGRSVEVLNMSSTHMAANFLNLAKDYYKHIYGVEILYYDECRLHFLQFKDDWNYPLLYKKKMTSKNYTEPPTTPGPPGPARVRPGVFAGERKKSTSFETTTVETTSVETVIVEPTVEPTIETFTVEPTDETTAIDPTDETTAIDPTDETTTIDPTDETTLDETTTYETTLDEPADETTMVTVMDETTTTESMDETTMVELTDDTATVEPTDETTTVETTAETTTRKPTHRPMRRPTVDSLIKDTSDDLEAVLR